MTAAAITSRSGRDKAAELRVLATTIKSIEIQEKACRLADEYDGFADQTEASGNIRSKTQAQSRQRPPSPDTPAPPGHKKNS